MRSQQEPPLLLQLGKPIRVHAAPSSSSQRRGDEATILVVGNRVGRRLPSSERNAQPHHRAHQSCSGQRPHQRVDARSPGERAAPAAEALLDEVDDLIVAHRAGVDLTSDLDADGLRVGVARLEHALAVADRDTPGDG